MRASIGARSARDLRALHDCYNRFVRWRMAGIWDSIMEALAETHDGSVQMIDTSIVRVHQHGGCAGGAETRLMGRSRGGLTTKIHAASIATECRFALN
jgi:transposase